VKTVIVPPEEVARRPGWSCGPDLISSPVEVGVVTNLSDLAEARFELGVVAAQAWWGRAEVSDARQGQRLQLRSTG